MVGEHAQHCSVRLLLGIRSEECELELYGSEPAFGCEAGAWITNITVMAL